MGPISRNRQPYNDHMSNAEEDDIKKWDLSPQQTKKFERLPTRAVVAKP